MNIFYNNIPEKLPSNNMTLADLANFKKLPAQGTAIAINDKLVKRDLWKVTPLHDMDRVTVITAAYGG